MSKVHPEQVADRLAIMDLLNRYARGIDRCDPDVLRAVWWPGAKADYGSGEVDALAWSDGVIPALSSMRRTQHFLGNMLIDIGNGVATAETYCRAWHEVDGPDGPQEMEVGGRYLDRLQRRGDEWRLLHRRYVLDWSRNGPSTARWDGPLYDGLTRHGKRTPHDPLYTGE
ncbi:MULTISPECIES: nuclear transport factor 2 family protein [Novosphingobium]|uniref:nuclear transport factor 2 family protein n=1 Tax=Novosphingobium TaxID=165696 RepID=UPI001CD37124|nr:nuclear transport factor 2 family protein [Novosphingobium percolationis]